MCNTVNTFYYVTIYSLYLYVLFIVLQQCEFHHCGFNGFKDFESSELNVVTSYREGPFTCFYRKGHWLKNCTMTANERNLLPSCGCLKGKKTNLVFSLMQYESNN